MVITGPRIRRRHEEERIILMKSRDRRAERILEDMSEKIVRKNVRRNVNNNIRKYIRKERQKQRHKEYQKICRKRVSEKISDKSVTKYVYQKKVSKYIRIHEDISEEYQKWRCLIENLLQEACWHVCFKSVGQCHHRTVLVLSSSVWWHCS